MSLRNWNLPEGVDPGTWDYVNSRSIADQYETYFQDHPLFAVDQSLVEASLGPPQKKTWVADFGCGNGRALLPLVAKGFHGLGIDLSLAMLQQVKRAALQRDLLVDCVHANLVEMDGIADNSVDHGICLFSTLGMIKGRANRQRALGQFSRVIKPGGILVLHVHNYWYNLLDPGGPWWLVRNRIRSWWDRAVERGDKHYPYRGLTNMFLHVFTRSEIRSDLATAGWQVTRWVPLEPKTLQPWERPGMMGAVRTVGWVIVCRNGTAAEDQSGIG